MRLFKRLICRGTPSAPRASRHESRSRLFRRIPGCNRLDLFGLRVPGPFPPFASALAKGYTLRDVEREYIVRVLDQTNGNKTEAAKILGVDRTTLYRKLEEYKVKE